MIISSDRDWGCEGIGTTSPGSTLSGMRMGIRLDDVESGPSAPRRVNHSNPSLALSFGQDDQDGMCRCELCLTSSETSAQQSRRPRRKSRQTRPSLSSSSSTARSPSSTLSLLPAFLLPFLSLPVVSAAPPPTRRRRFPRSPLPAPTLDESRPRPDPRSLQAIEPREDGVEVNADPTATTTTTIEEHRKIKYLTSVSTPSVLPTANSYVDETVLPYLLSRHEDGSWTRAEGGWSLYGRQVATPTTGPIFADDGGSADAEEPSVTAPSYAVESVLPNGWGVSSNRTSIYKVPLISIASVIMATGIVALIVFIVLSRRKQHRKRKRAKERMRRKALAAAGIKEEDLHSTAKEAMFKEKLKELENQHLAKKKKNGQVGVAKSKVRVWNQRMGMRRRKKATGTKAVNEDEDGAESIADTPRNGDARNEGNEEGEEEDKPVEGVDSASPSPVLSRDGEENDVASNRSSSDTDRGDPPGDSGHVGLTNSSHDNQGHAETAPADAAPTGVPHFPPAYRPASVRSLPRHTPASSSSAGPSHPQPAEGSHPTVVSGAEKTQAPGYYPAPATEDGEIALAVASRSEGKSRMVEPPAHAPEEEAEESDESHTIRHIATDDKRVLERLRLGASAPPVQATSPEDASAQQGQDGPSAPGVRLDDDGFEQLDETHLHVPIPEPAMDDVTARSDVLPEPPRLNARLSSRLNDFSSSSTSTSAMNNDISHLLPSAPPISQDVGSAGDAPSAPPILDDEGYEDDSHIPSAPALESAESEDVEAFSDTHSSGQQNSDVYDSSPLTSTTSNEPATASEPRRPEEATSQTESAGIEEDSDNAVEADHREPESELELGQELDSEQDNSTFSNAVPARTRSGTNTLFLPRYEP
ncbi:uncharacterized protein I303_102650 [Kwoniella dejecticola CBS 10117]|uniref:Uncharacterized protein n=1 Tax=Kwoniella dejecticola CBS 10117 TaxID=1296121 RepID=A0A1A6A9C1_9TREE|nr:uncharacterized protein I303_02664 [Kwoniella dejecticola CBS 10117]OBR86654.1 hypothetical protein I303_02664 [Kwoniella dejecticola CBS 10117]